jgi:hypothetical protein
VALRAQVEVEVDTARGRLAYRVNGARVAPSVAVADPRIASGVYFFAAMDGYNNVLPKLTVERVVFETK